MWISHIQFPREQSDEKPVKKRSCEEPAAVFQGRQKSLPAEPMKSTATACSRSVELRTLNAKSGARAYRGPKPFNSLRTQSIAPRARGVESANTSVTDCQKRKKKGQKAPKNELQESLRTCGAMLDIGRPRRHTSLQRRLRIGSALSKIATQISGRKFEDGICSID